MSITKTTKQFFSISSDDATNANNINSMQFNFNNTALTSIQNSLGQSCVFTPVNLTIDWDYTNISEALKNNRMIFTVGVNAPVAVIVENGSYNASNFCAWLNINLNAGGAYPITNGLNAMTWFAQYDALSNRIALAYSVSASGAVVTKIETRPIIATVQYDMTRILGMSKSSPDINQSTMSIVSGNTGLFTSPKYNPNGVDYKVFDVLRIHSNVAKRFFELKGNGRKALSSNSVLFELVVPSITMGSSLVWENLNSHIYSQDIISNFDNLTIEIKDKNGNLIDFKSYCSFNMTFIVERTVEQQSSTDRLKNLSNFNLLSSV